MSEEILMQRLRQTMIAMSAAMALTGAMALLGDQRVYVQGGRDQGLPSHRAAAGGRLPAIRRQH